MLSVLEGPFAFRGPELVKFQETKICIVPRHVTRVAQHRKFAPVIPCESLIISSTITF